MLTSGERVSNASQSNIGGLVGRNSGNIVAGSSQGSVRGYFQTGGLVGYNTGQVVSGQSASQVFGNSYVGGLVGINEGNAAVVETSTANGAVNGIGGIGGLVGWNRGGRVLAGQAHGKVTATGSEVGGLVGNFLWLLLLLERLPASSGKSWYVLNFSVLLFCVS